MRFEEYKKKGYIVFEYYFENLHRFIEYITTKETNTRVFDVRDLASKTGRFDFTKTYSLDEAIRLCSTGWDEDFSTLLELKEKVDEKFLDTKTVNKRIKDCVGFAPSVPDFLHDNPINMWNRVYEPVYDIINIYVNISYPCGTDTSSIYNRGAIILSLVDVFERMGYGVKLTVFEFCRSGDEVILAYFNIKDETENLNLKKSYFALCHPSFLRRLGFRLKEVTPFNDLGWEGSYGKVFERSETIKFFDLDLRKNILFTAPYQMGIKGDNLYENLERVLKEISQCEAIKLA